MCSDKATVWAVHVICEKALVCVPVYLEGKVCSRCYKRVKGGGHDTEERISAHS